MDLIRVGRGSRKRNKAWAEEIDDPYEPCSLALGGFLVFVSGAFSLASRGDVMLGRRTGLSVWGPGDVCLSRIVLYDGD